MKLFNKKKFDVPRRRLNQDTASQAALSDVFKRNRTLTGTTSNNLDSIDARSMLESSRTKTHHLTIKRRKVMGILLVVLISILILWALISNFTAKAVVSVQNAGLSKQVDLSTYEKAIQEYLDNNPIGRMGFLLDQAGLSSYVSDKLPEVSNVSQKSSLGFGETGFSVTMRVPVAGWKINDKQYYVDSAGVPFENNYFSEPSVQIIDNSGVSLQTGTVSVSNRFLGFVGRVVSLSKASGYTVTQAILPAGTTRQLEIRLKEANYSVKLSIDRPAGEQVEDMSRAIGHFIGEARKPQYIDVRVSGKAFYK